MLVQEGEFVQDESGQGGMKRAANAEGLPRPHMARRNNGCHTRMTSSVPRSAYRAMRIAQSRRSQVVHERCAKARDCPAGVPLRD